MDIGYYEQLLAAMGASLVAGVAVSVHPAVAVYQGVAGGSLPATLFLYEALFRNPPTSPTAAQTAGVVGWHLVLFVVLFRLL